jgi:cell division transport system permease protein
MRATVVLTEVGNGLRRNLGLTVAVILTVLVAGILGGISFLLHEQVNVMKSYWYDKVEVSIYLCGTDSVAPSCLGPDGTAQAVTEAQREQIKADLLSLPQVQTVYYEDKAEAYAHFQEQFKGSPIAANAPPDSLPESFRVKLKDPKTFAAVTGAFTGRAGVEEVQDERQLLDKLFSALNGIQRGGLIIAVMMVVAALLLIANTIRVAAFTRRRETGIMRLVGASNLSIQLPFLLESVVAAMVGALLASGFLTLGKAFLVDGILAPSFQFTPFFGWESVWKAGVLVLIASMLIAASASMITLRRYLRI